MRDQLPTIGLAELAAIRGGVAPNVSDPRGNETLKELITKPSTDGSFTRLLPFLASQRR